MHNSWSKSVFQPLTFLLVVSGLYVHVPRRLSCPEIGRCSVGLAFCVSGVATMSKYVYDKVRETVDRFTEPLDTLLFSLLILCFALGLCHIAVFQVAATSRHLRVFDDSMRLYMDSYVGGAGPRPWVRPFVWAVCVVLLLASVGTGVLVDRMREPSFVCGQMNKGCLDRLTHVWLLHRIFLYLEAPAALYAVLLHLLCHEMRRFNAEFAQTCSKPTYSELSSPVSSPRSSVKTLSSPDSLESFRARYNALCRLVEEATCALRHFLLVTFYVGIPVTLLAVRTVLRGQLSDRLTFFVGFIMAYHSTVLVVVTITGAILSALARRPAEVLHQLNMDRLTERECHSLAVFLARVQGPPVGFSVAGMFTVDTSTILMVLGTVVTYMVVILQLQANSPDMDQPVSFEYGAAPVVNITSTAPTAL